VKLVAAFALAGAALLSGCAATEQWAHPALEGSPKASDTATLEMARCNNFAATGIPPAEPPMYTPVPAPTVYNTTGSYQNYGAGGYYSATTTASGGFASGLAQGANAGASIGAAIRQARVRNERHKVAVACMHQRGWIDVSTDEGRAELQKAVQSNKPVN
jgi:hypothetical protein